jgi:hypothetical protein
MPISQPRKLGSREWFREPAYYSFARRAGACTIMGTASTMTNLAEALDMTLPGCAAIPAPEARRLTAFTPPPPACDRGCGKLFLDHVTQAHLGCDFDFLRAVGKAG